MFYCSSRTDSSEGHPLDTLRGAAETSFTEAGLVHHHPGPPALQKSTHFLLPTFIATTCRTANAGAKETGSGTPTRVRCWEQEPGEQGAWVHLATEGFPEGSQGQGSRPRTCTKNTGEKGSPVAAGCHTHVLLGKDSRA